MWNCLLLTEHGQTDMEGPNFNLRIAFVIKFCSSKKIGEKKKPSGCLFY